MKTTHITRASALLGVLLASLVSHSGAGTINIDFQTLTSTAYSGKGGIGEGAYWNHVINDTGNQIDIRDDQGNPTGVEIKISHYSDAADVGGMPDVRSTWIYNGPDPQAFLIITITGLRKNQLHKLAYYNPYSIAQSMTQFFQGVSSPGSRAVASGKTIASFPGNEGEDYATMLCRSDSKGAIYLSINPETASSYASISGLQIQGWLMSEVDPFDVDLSLSRKASSGYVGEGVYSVIPAAQQRVTSKTRGKRPSRFYAKLKNDSMTMGEMSFRGTAGKRKAKIRYTSFAAGEGNVTAQVVAGIYKSPVDPGAGHRFQVKIKPKKRSGKRINCFMGVGTVVTDTEDVGSIRLKVKR